jgi:hypothetical protein
MFKVLLFFIVTFTQANPLGITQLSTANARSCIVRNDEIRCWGGNLEGLGIGEMLYCLPNILGYKLETVSH